MSEQQFHVFAQFCLQVGQARPVDPFRELAKEREKEAKRLKEEMDKLKREKEKEKEKEERPQVNREYYNI